MAYPFKTPTPTSTLIGSGMARPDWPPPGYSVSDPHALEAWMTLRTQKDPSYKIPAGFHREDDGTVKADEPSWLIRHYPQLVTAFIGIGLGYGAFGGTGGGAGAFDAAGNFVGPTTYGGVAAETGVESAAFDAAGNFIGPSTYGSSSTIAPASSGIWGNLEKGYGAYKSGKSIWDSVYGLGQDLGAAGYGRANARVAEARLQQEQDQLALERYRAGLSGAGVDIAQRNFALQAPSQRASNAVRGDVLANAQDVSFSGLPPRLQGMIPTISGGLRPSMFSPQTRQLGGLLSSQALEGQQKGDIFAPLPTLPAATPLPSGNALDTGLTLGGTAASLAPSFWDLLSRYRKRNAGTPDYGSGGSDGSGGSTDTPGWDTGYG